ncbi:MAG TPA: hypothetical protein VIZ17_18290, partial [Acetobacteraceae bacterium]
MDYAAYGADFIAIQDMLGSPTTPDQPAARDGATRRVAFQLGNPVASGYGAFAARWPAYVLPCRRFA